MRVCVEQLERAGEKSLNYLFYFVGFYIGIVYYLWSWLAIGADRLMGVNMKMRKRTNVDYVKCTLNDVKLALGATNALPQKRLVDGKLVLKNWLELKEKDHDGNDVFTTWFFDLREYEAIEEFFNNEYEGGFNV